MRLGDRIATLTGGTAEDHPQNVEGKDAVGTCTVVRQPVCFCVLPSVAATCLSMATGRWSRGTGMYLDFYNLHEFPFSIARPRFLYFAPHHQEAYDHLMYGIQGRRGFIELTGEVGSGKTTLCRAVLANLGEGCETALILNPSLTETPLLGPSSMTLA